MDMTISNDTTYELTFTVTDFEVVTIQQLYDILGSNFYDIVVASHQPDDNNKNTHYHALFKSNENISVPSDFENKSSQEQAARRSWKKKLGNINGVIRTHYGRVKEYEVFAHYILVKCIDYLCSPELCDNCEQWKKELWCETTGCICKNCAIKNKITRKSAESLTQFEKIMKEFDKERICQHITAGICPHCYESGVIQRSMINYYLKRKKAVPIGRCAEMMLSAKAIMAPDEQKEAAIADIESAIYAKMQNNLKIY